MKKRIIIIFGIVFLVAIFLVTFFVFVKQENKKTHIYSQGKEFVCGDYLFKVDVRAEPIQYKPRNCSNSFFPKASCERMNEDDKVDSETKKSLVFFVDVIVMIIILKRN